MMIPEGNRTGFLMTDGGYLGHLPHDLNLGSGSDFVQKSYFWSLCVVEAMWKRYIVGFQEAATYLNISFIYMMLYV